MAAFDSVRLSTRIYIQQAFLVVSLIGLAAFSLYSINIIDHDLDVIQDEDLPLVRLMTTAVEKQLEQEYQVERMLRHGVSLGASAYAREEYEDAVHEFELENEEINRSETDAHELLDEAIAFSITEEEAEIFRKTQQQLELIREHHHEYEEAVTALRQAFDAGDISYALELGIEIEDQQEALAHESEAFLGDLAALLDRPLTEANRFIASLKTILWIASILVTVLAVGMTIYSGVTLSTLRQAMGNIGNSVQQVASASSQSGNAISVVSDGSKQQSEAISQAVTAVGQSVTTLAEVSKSAESATSLSKEAARTVDDGREQMRGMVEIVNRISENSGKIGKITEVISDIANQTNMLSLNAAIEAARAGEHGKGFAVVAEQVRKLAENSRSSVQDIAELISQATDDATVAVDSADKVNDEMGKIAEAAEGTEKVMQNIATSMEQQVATTEELQHNMDTLKGIGDNNANAAEEITQTILELSRISDETNVEVRKFNI